MFFPRTCIACGACEQVCPAGASRLIDGKLCFDRRLCSACGRCVAVCPADARRLAGRYISVPELLAEVAKDLPFYRTSNGGVTLSGGEPLVQPRFVLAFLEACKDKEIHTALDTSGQGATSDLEQMLAFIDLVLFDIKVLDAALHRSLTGLGNEDILANLRIVHRAGVPIIIRVPLILAFPDQRRNLLGIVSLAGSLRNLAGIDLLPAHNMAAHKYEALGISSDFVAPRYTDEQQRELEDLIAHATEVDTSAASSR